jgi:putative tryptophan/tyrosine transport system substrate-binding protein
MDATARVHSGARKCGGVSGGGAGREAERHGRSADERQRELRCVPTGVGRFRLCWGAEYSLILRDTGGNPDRLDQLASELVALDPDVIFGAGSPSTMALKRKTSTIPIVTLSASPLGLGFVASLARPGGNITGVSLFGPEVAAKRIELLKEIIPNAATAAVFWNPDDPSAQFSLSETQVASAALQLNLRVFETRTLSEIDNAFSAATKENVQAVILLPALFMGRNAGRIAELALASRLPTFGFVKAEPKAGELLSFGPDLPAAARRVAYFVDRILKGAHPGDLPVEQPTEFELVINLKTAKTLGIIVPNSVLVRADEVIE